MSNYKNHWTNERVEIKIGKLDEKTTYQIKDVEKIETSFGKRYVLVDNEIINIGQIKQLKDSYINIKTLRNLN